MTPRRDLLVLTACKDCQFAVQGILCRHKSLRIRPVAADFLVHPNKDAGCVTTSIELLRGQRSRYPHALVLFDREGSGQEGRTAGELEDLVGEGLRKSGWDERAAVVVLDPELEIWVWSESPQVDRILGWANHIPSLRSWLVGQRYLAEDEHKPGRPKEAMEAAMEVAEVRRSSAIYKELAEHVSLERCTDPAFLRLKEVLRGWFQLGADSTEPSR